MARVRVHLPRSLLSYWSGVPRTDVDAATLAALLDALDVAHPGLRARIVAEDGRLREHVNVFVNRERVTARPGDVALREGDDVHVLPAVSGGATRRSV